VAIATLTPAIAGDRHFNACDRHFITDDRGDHRVIARGEIAMRSPQAFIFRSVVSDIRDDRRANLHFFEV
jgi:hypothetical protein